MSSRRISAAEGVAISISTLTDRSSRRAEPDPPRRLNETHEAPSRREGRWARGENTSRSTQRRNARFRGEDGWSHPEPRPRHAGEIRPRTKGRGLPDGSPASWAGADVRSERNERSKHPSR